MPIHAVTVTIVCLAVRLASGGVGKAREGDGKLPLGTYALGKARTSKQYGIFIPIGYPTADQSGGG